MVRIAEDVRRRREAEESGRRQAEAILRQREDVLYQELMQVHQGTVDSYLQGIVVNTIDTTSSLQAYEEAKLKAQTLNNFLDRIEERRNKPETFIKDLVASFLIPDVQRKKLQRQRKIHNQFMFLKCNLKRRSSQKQQKRSFRAQLLKLDKRLKTIRLFTIQTQTRSNDCVH